MKNQTASRNSVQEYVYRTGESEVAVMNELMARGVVSDNCLAAADVSELDGQFIGARLFPMREFALSRSGEWLTDPYRPGETSWPKPAYYTKENQPEKQP